MKVKTKSHLTAVGILILMLFALQGEVWTARLTVGVIGDQTGAADLEYAYGILQKGVDVLKNKKLDIVIHVGDLVESKLDDEEIIANYQKATGIIKQLKIPWYLTPGDHDVNPVNYQPNSQDRSKEKLFQKLYAQDNPAVKKTLYYSFDIKKYHFIALYSLEHLHTDPRWGNVFFSKISDSQYKWLREDLEHNKLRKAIIVFVHQPMWYNWSSWSRVHQLLSRYPVKAVIAGHYHYNQYEGLLDGINYLVVGATGGDIKNANPNAGGIHHVTLMTIKGQEINFLPLPVEPELPKMEFSSRYDMDRVQALDTVLGNLWNFSRLNKIFLKGNKLVGDCSSEVPAQLKLASIGNAAEFPVDIAMTFKSDSPAIILDSCEFAEGVCQEEGGQEQCPFACTLTPSIRVYLANTSSVSVYSDPLWAGILDLKTNEPLPNEGTNMCLTVSFSFMGINGKPFIISSKSPACTQLKFCQ